MTVFGFLTSAEKSKRLSLSAGPVLLAARAVVTQSAQHAAGLAHVSNSECSDSSLAHELLLGLDSWRLAAGVASCAQVLQQARGAGPDAAAKCSWLADVWLLHLVLMRAMPLQQRTLRCLPAHQKDDHGDAGKQKGLKHHDPPQAGSVDEQLSHFVTPVMHSMEGLVNQFPAFVRPNSVQPAPPGSRGISWEELQRAELTDSYDCRLYSTLAELALQVQTQQQLPPVVMVEWKKACSALRSLMQAATVGSPNLDRAASSPSDLATPPPALLAARGSSLQIQHMCEILQDHSAQVPQPEPAVQTAAGVAPDQASDALAVRQCRAPTVQGLLVCGSSHQIKHLMPLR